MEPDQEKKEKKSETEMQDTVKVDSVTTQVKEPGNKKPIEVVFVVKDEIVHQVPVKTGISSDTEWEILKGVEEGDEVASGSFEVLSKKLSDGDKVKIDNSLKKGYQD
jgi:HlyD family secretion protein